MGGIPAPVAAAGHLRPTRAELAPGILIAVKALIVLTTLTALAVPAMHEFRGEAMLGRVLVYAVAVLAIPAGWLACGRRSYPVAADAFLMVPLGFDLVGNSLHLYARFDHYDKVAHLVGVAAAALFAAALLRRHVGGRVALAAVAVAGGLAIGIAIELFEFAVFTHPAATGLGAYRDTVGDLAMDLLGACAAAAILACPVRPCRPPSTRTWLGHPFGNPGRAGIGRADRSLGRELRWQGPQRRSAPAASEASGISRRAVRPGIQEGTT